METEDSSDDEIYWMLFLDYLDQLLARTIRDRTNQFDIYDDIEFRSRFRLTKACVVTLLELIENNLVLAIVVMYQFHHSISCSFPFDSTRASF